MNCVGGMSYIVILMGKESLIRRERRILVLEENFLVDWLLKRSLRVEFFIKMVCLINNSEIELVNFFCIVVSMERERCLCESFVSNVFFGEERILENGRMDG